MKSHYAVLQVFAVLWATVGCGGSSLGMDTANLPNISTIAPKIFDCDENTEAIRTQKSTAFAYQSATPQNSGFGFQNRHNWSPLFIARDVARSDFDTVLLGNGKAVGCHLISPN